MPRLTGLNSIVSDIVFEAVYNFFCLPVWLLLYHMTISCKRPITIYSISIWELICLFYDHSQRLLPMDSCSGGVHAHPLLNCFLHIFNNILSSLCKHGSAPCLWNGAPPPENDRGSAPVISSILKAYLHNCEISGDGDGDGDGDGEEDVRHLYALKVLSEYFKENLKIAKKCFVTSSFEDYIDLGKRSLPFSAHAIPSRSAAT